jgi:hypothetical protein
MQTTKDFIALLKTKHGLKSNYAVAKLLNQTDTAVARWAHGKNSFSDETAMQFADLLDLDPAYVVACMHAERAKLDAEKKLWERIATMSLGVAASLLVAFALPFTSADDMQYGLIALSTAPFSGHCILCQTLIVVYWPYFLALFGLMVWAYSSHHPFPKKSRTN